MPTPRPRLEPILAIAGLLAVALLVGFAPALAVEKEPPVKPTVFPPEPVSDFSNPDAGPPENPEDTFETGNGGKGSSGGSSDPSQSGETGDEENESGHQDPPATVEPSPQARGNGPTTLALRVHSP